MRYCVGEVVGAGEGTRVGMKVGIGARVGKDGCVGAGDGIAGADEGLLVAAVGGTVGDPGDGEGLVVGAGVGRRDVGKDVGARLVMTICPPQDKDE